MNVKEPWDGLAQLHVANLDAITPQARDAALRVERRLDVHPALAIGPRERPRVLLERRAVIRNIIRPGP
jgi:hypothetical protein